MCELLWLDFLLTDLHEASPKPFLMWSDNQTALDIMKNLVFHERTKYLDIDCHNWFMRNTKKALFSKVVFHFYAQLANLSTKPLPTSHFSTFSFQVGLAESSSVLNLWWEVKLCIYFHCTTGFLSFAKCIYVASWGSMYVISLIRFFFS